MQSNNEKSGAKHRFGAHPLLFLGGYTVIECEAERLKDVLNLCSTLEISYRGVQLTDDSRAFLCISFFSWGKLKTAADGYDIPLVEKTSRGIPVLISKHKHRLGIPIGIIVSLLIIFFSSGVIWDIRVDGAERLCEEDVISVLDDCGLRVGSKKSKLEISSIENAALILSDEISWISVNVIGTVANVEIRELDFAPEPEDNFSAANVVASENGKILGFEDIKGNIAVHIGDYVSRGQLLIGGIYGDEENGFRYTAAKGRVLAEVERTLVEQIPRNYRKKSYTGEKKCEKFLVFFKKEIKIFSNCGNLYPSYDKIDTIEYLRAPNGDDLPIGIRTVRYLEYTHTDQSHTDTELIELAQYKLRADIASALSDGELLGKLVDFELNESGIILNCSIRSIEDIAKTQEIKIES